MESINGGKLFSNSYTLDLGGCVATLRYCAGWADKIHGRTIPVGEQLWETTRGEGRHQEDHCRAELFQTLPFKEVTQKGRLILLLDFETMQLRTWKFCYDLSNGFLKIVSAQSCWRYLENIKGRIFFCPQLLNQGNRLSDRPHFSKWATNYFLCIPVVKFIPFL